MVSKDEVIKEVSEGDKESISDEEYSGLIMEEKEILFALMQMGRHPTQFLCDVMESFYGHRVPLNKLIELIETSELPMLNTEKDVVDDKGEENV